MKRALITGITGQDGSYLAELLLNKGYEVHGLIRRTSSFSTGRIDHLYVEPHLPECKMFLQFGDMSDGSSMRHLLGELQPDEVYNLAAQSHVRVSFQQPEYTADVTGMGVLRMLEAIRDVQDRTGKAIRFYQASSSEMFGNAGDPPYNEETPLRPRSPYACAKVFAFWQTVNYREAYGLFACNGILFNHESERRGETFVSRKISRAAARIKMGLQQELFLGNLDAVRDWGYAPDYVEAMWLMLQQDQADDFVIATGDCHSVREFLAEAFGHVDLEWRDFVKFDPYYLRPTEVDRLVGDASKARRVLGWEPKVAFKGLVHRMVDHDLELSKREAHAATYDAGKGGAEGVTR